MGLTVKALPRFLFSILFSFFANFKLRRAVKNRDVKNRHKHLLVNLCNDSCHRRTGRGAGGGAAAPPKILGNLDFLGSKRNLGKANYLRCFQAVF